MVFCAAFADVGGAKEDAGFSLLSIVGEEEVAGSSFLLRSDEFDASMPPPKSRNA
jgi:hypothetical protein